MFERRQYEAVARVVGEYLGHATHGEGVSLGEEDLTARFITLFKIDNPRFDSEKFIKAVNKVNVTPRAVRVRKEGEEGRN